jgi:outer membrane protein
MSRRALVLLLLLACCAAPARGQSLAEAVREAYVSNPILAEARARQEALAEAPEQARAGGRITVTLDGGADYGAGDTASTTLTAAYPLWTGGRVTAAVRAADAEVVAGRERLRAREMEVLESVVAAYAEVLFAQEAEQVAQIGMERLDRQIEEAQLRFELGQATRTDVAQLRAQRAGIAGSLADARAALGRARAAYRAVVGIEVVRLAPATMQMNAVPTSLEAARAAARAGNPELLEQLAFVAAAQARIAGARAQWTPDVALVGSAGAVEGLGATGLRSGFDRQSSLSIAVRIPLLTGGLVPSRIREAEANARAERFAAEAAEREALRAVDAAWSNLRGAEERLAAGEEGLVAADLALRGVRTEYELGLRTTIDLLIAEQSFQAAQLGVARSRSDLMLAAAGLLRAAGVLSASALK